jgi:hypothetical protein
LLGAVASLLIAANAFGADSVFVKLEQIGGKAHWTYAVTEEPIEIDPVPAGSYRMTIVNTGDTNITHTVSARIWIMGFVDNAHSLPFLVGSYTLDPSKRAHPLTRPNECTFDSKDPLIVWIHIKDFEASPTAPKFPKAQTPPDPENNYHPKHHRRKHR